MDNIPKMFVVTGLVVGLVFVWRAVTTEMSTAVSSRSFSTVTVQGTVTPVPITTQTTTTSAPESTPVPLEVVAVDTVLVARVIDGDTVEIEGGERVRYTGVNAPESKDPRKPVQCFGKEAAAYNAKLVEGKRVRLEADVQDRDKYGRLLRYVWIGDMMINERLAYDGYAQVMTIPPNVRYADRFRIASQNAREKKHGLWGKCRS